MSKKKIKILHDLAKEKIVSQHDIGIRIANDGVELINKNRNNSRNDVDSFKIKYEHWYDITSETLNEIFVSTDYSSKFRKQRSSKVEYVSSSWQPDIKYYLTKEIKPKIEYLKMLADNILAFDVINAEPEPAPEQDKENKTIPDSNSMTLREKIENNPMAWLFSMLLTGYLAGIGTYKAILEIAHLDVISEQDLKDLRISKSSQIETNQKIGAKLGSNLTKQIEILTAAHNQRLSELQKQFLAAEKGVSDNTNPDSYKESYRESAKRIKQLISNEDESYNESLKELQMLR